MAALQISGEDDDRHDDDGDRGDGLMTTTATTTTRATTAAEMTAINHDDGEDDRDDDDGDHRGEEDDGDDRHDGHGRNGDEDDGEDGDGEEEADFSLQSGPPRATCPRSRRRCHELALCGRLWTDSDQEDGFTLTHRDGLRFRSARRRATTARPAAETSTRTGAAGTARRHPLMTTGFRPCNEASRTHEAAVTH